MSVGELRIMDQTGDHKIIWDTSRPDEVQEARGTFERLRAKGYIAYRVNPGDGGKGEIMREFDQAAGKIILAPAMQGG